MSENIAANLPAPAPKAAAFQTPSKPPRTPAPMSTPKSSLSAFNSSFKSQVTKYPGTPCSPANSLRSTPGKSRGTPSRSAFGSQSSTGSGSRDAAIQAREQSTKDRIEKVLVLKEKWAREKDERIQAKAAQQAQISAKLLEQAAQLEVSRKKNLERQRQIEAAAREAEREALAAYSRDRVQARAAMLQAEKERRRASVAIRSEIHKQSKEAEAKIVAEDKERELSILESSRLDALAARAAKEAAEAARRQSVMFRVSRASQQRLIETQLVEQEKEFDVGLIQTRYLGWQDEKEEEKRLERLKRESLAGRLGQWRKQRAVEEEEVQKQRDALLEEMQTRYEGWKDVEAMKVVESQRKRESLQGRWQKHQADRRYDEQQRADEAEVAAYESRLRAQEAEDLAAFKEAEKQKRRESLAYRLGKAKQDGELEEGKRAMARWLEAEEAKIRQQGRLDVEAYYQALQDSRRQSLEYRSQLMAQERLRLEGIRQCEAEQAQINRELDRAAWQDIRNYHEAQRAARRESLARHLAIRRTQEQQHLQAHRTRLDALHDQLTKSRHAEKQAVEVAEEEVGRRRRLSMTLRVESWREAKLVKERDAEKKRMAEEEDIQARVQDWEDVQRAKAELAAQEKTALLGKMNF